MEIKKYQEQLDKEINADRQAHVKNPLKYTDKVGTKEIVQSRADKEGDIFHKNEKEKCFAYLAHTACDDFNFILSFEVTDGNVHDIVVYEDVNK